MNSESVYFIFWEFIALKWEIDVWMLSRVWNLPFVQTGNLVIIMNTDRAEIIQKFSSILILNTSVSGEEFKSAWRDFLAVFDTKKLGISNQLL